MNEHVKIGEKYHLIAANGKTECGRAATGVKGSGPVPFGTLCEKCKEVRAIRERNF